LEYEKKELIKNIKESHKILKKQIIKTTSITLNENISLTKVIKPLHLTEYLKYYQEKLKLKKTNLYEVIDKEKLEEIERTQKINEHRIKNERKKALHKKMLMIILTVAAHLTRSKLSLSEFIELHEQSLIKLSFFKEDFNLLKNAIKDNDEKKVKFLIEQNKFLCQMYDDFNQTALHVASKRKRGEIIKIILKYGAKIDVKDCVGRTALHYACLYNNLENVEILLFELASPLIKDHYNKQPGDYSTDSLIKFFILRAKNLIDLNLRRINFKESLKAIRNGLEFFFNIPEDTLRKMI
jgi:ankyrin repeat protein